MRAVSVGRINSILFLGFLVFTALYFARDFLIPFTVGILLAMLMLPVCKKLEGWGVNRGISIVICILIILLVIAGVITILSAQVVSFSEDFPQVQQKVEKQIPVIQKWIEREYNVPPEKQTAYIKENLSSMGNSVSTIFKNFVSGTIGALTTLLLILVYVFFFLYYREKYENFIFRIKGNNSNHEVKNTLDQITQVAVQYIVGRAMAIGILAVLYAVGLLAAGIKYALLLACIAALFSFIPYVGTILGGVFAASTALVTKSPQAALIVIGIIALIQLADEYFIEPYVVGSKVSLSPLAIIIILVIGGLLWGIAGMILFIPLLSIAKIIFDHVPSLHPYGYLVGEEDEGGDSGESAFTKIKGWFGKKDA